MYLTELRWDIVKIITLEISLIHQIFSSTLLGMSENERKK